MYILLLNEYLLLLYLFIVIYAGVGINFILSFMFSLMQQLTQELEQDDGRSFRHQVGSPIANSPPGRYLSVL